MNPAHRGILAATVLLTATLGSTPASGAYRLKGTRIAYVGQPVTLRISPKPPSGTRFSWGASLGFPDFGVPKNARSRVLRHRFDHSGTFTVSAQFQTGPGINGLRMVTTRIRIRHRVGDPTRYCSDSVGGDDIGRYAAFIATNAGCVTAYRVLDRWLSDGAGTDTPFVDGWTYGSYDRNQDRNLIHNLAGQFIRFAYFQNGE